MFTVELTRRRRGLEYPPDARSHEAEALKQTFALRNRNSEVKLANSAMRMILPLHARKAKQPWLAAGISRSLQAAEEVPRPGGGVSGYEAEAPISPKPI
jgi:hypothetical protein